MKVPHDTVIQELRNVASLYDNQTEDLAMAMAVYMLGFNTYNGFKDGVQNELGDIKENALKRIYEYAKNFSR